jgi:MFS transporter, DHA1 family, tetracycline resistance protein
MPNRSIKLIFITILLDVIGWGIIIPITPGLISELKNVSVADASSYGRDLLVVYAVIQFICAPIIGGLSDKYGRRPILLIALLGFGLDYFLQAWAPTYAWLFVGRVIAGITGSSITTSQAYISDISEPHEKAKNFGMVGAAFGMGFILGPLIGGLMHQFGARVPFVVAGCFTLINFVFCYWWLPESLLPKNRRDFSLKRANPVGTLLQLIKLPLVMQLMGCMLLIYIGAMAVQSTWNFYTISRYGWSETMVGISLAIVGALVGLTQTLLTQKAIKVFGQKKAIYIGLCLYGLGCLLFGLAPQGWMLFAALIPYCAGGIAGPALQSIISNSVERNQQGELSGAFASLISFSSIIGPAIMLSSFYYFSQLNAVFYLQGAQFYIGSLLLLLAAVWAWFVLKNKKL